MTRSDEFRIRWAMHNVRFHLLGIQRIPPPLMGELELDDEAMDLPANPDWFRFAHTTEPGSPADERLQLLGSLAATGPRVAANSPTPPDLQSRAGRPPSSRGVGGRGVYCQLLPHWRPRT